MSVTGPAEPPPPHAPTHLPGQPRRLPARWVAILGLSGDVALAVGLAERWVFGLLAGIGTIFVLYWVIE